MLKTDERDEKSLPSAHLYEYHIGILFSGFLLGIFATYHFASLNLHFPGDLEAARRLGIVSVTILAQYPKSKDVIFYASMLGFPILFSITLWSLWATNQRRRDLVRLYGPPKEISRTKGVGWFVCLLSIIEDRKSNATAPRFSLCLWPFYGGWLLHCLCCFLYYGISASFCTKSHRVSKEIPVQRSKPISIALPSIRSWDYYFLENVGLIRLIGHLPGGGVQWAVGACERY